MPQRSKAYADAGVNLESANTLVARLKEIVSGAHTKGVVSDIGGFGGLFRPDLGGMREPLLVASADGVGTKLKLAFAFDKHDTVGQDLVAMNVNDILVQGAKPLFFLDYFASGMLDVDKAEAVIRGVAHGCKLSGCALLGGETAEMPDMYPEGEYDLAGFCVGMVDNEKIVDGSSTSVGDAVIGLASSGVHSNGFSLVRKLLHNSGLKGTDPFPGAEGKTVAGVLLEPTTIYVKTVQNLLRDFDVKGMVHITGGGFYDNIPRVLPDGVKAKLEFETWDVPAVFHWLMEQGNLTWEEMFQIFNCGIGYIVIVSKNDVQDVLDRLDGLEQKGWVIGNIARRTSKKAEQVEIATPAGPECG